jgi:predicted Zn-dependent protease
MEHRTGALAKLVALGLVVSLILVGWPDRLHAQSISLIRDAETENLMRRFATPIWVVAGLEPSVVRIHIVGDDSINAFVAGGQRLFLNTGLIMKMDNPSELMGVIAHETGHMAGGHLARAQESLSSYSLPMLASMLLGIGAMAAGAGGAGMAVIAGGAQFAQRGILEYSREQESRADQAGATFLDKAGLSGHGMLTLFEKFRDQEAMSSDRMDPFAVSHPVSEDRLSALQDRLSTSPYYNKTDSAADIHDLKMVQAKLFAFLNQPDSTFRRYPESDTSDYAVYARAIAYHKESETNRAIQELEPLIRKYPNDPYLHELKGQIYFESGRGIEAVGPYREATRLLPTDPQLQLGLGQALLVLEKADSDRESLRYLEYSAKNDPENPFAFYQLSIAYGRLNDIGKAELATAEYYGALGAARDASEHAKRATKSLKAGSPQWLRAQDIYAQMPDKAPK